jgi:hypothetical protein
MKGLAHTLGACLLASCAGAKAPPAGPPATLPALNAAAIDAGGDAGAPEAITDEGMWLLNDFPFQRVAERYGFTPTVDWLNHVRLSAVRLGGCSASFVSSRGLVMTNHHCAHSCIAQKSSAHRDYVATGFYAKTEENEIACPEIEVDQLVDISDVTDRVVKATAGLEGARYAAAHKAEMTKIEKACATSDDTRCDVVTLYHGGRYNLYKYRRYQDVRLVFAPEFDTAFFGGDPDNFMFPRYDLDVSFLRVYKDRKPLETSDYFRWSPAGAKEGDLTFVAGHPAHTSRELTVAELTYLRDVDLPVRLLRLAEARGMVAQFQTEGAEQKRISGPLLFSLENAMKALKGRSAALRDPEAFGAIVARENDLRARVKADPQLASAAGAWDAIAAAQTNLRNIAVRYQQLEGGIAFSSDLFAHARRLLRLADERTKPDAERLREYTDAQLPALRQRTLSDAPIYDELEILTLTHSLRRMREELGPDDPLVKRVLGVQSPRELATQLVKSSRLKKLEVRKALFEGGKPAVDASKDPMIELARAVDPDARAVRRSYEDGVEAVVQKNSELIAKARFLLLGTSVYPDATGTLRISYGQVRGWEENGTPVSPFTTFGGAFERATGREPFLLPPSWLKAKSNIDLKTPLNFVTTNDIIGGNSGSPVIDRDARIVGLIFDGNIHSLGGDYFYAPKDNRAVAVDSRALVEALDKIYGARRIVDELK